MTANPNLLSFDAALAAILRQVPAGVDRAIEQVTLAAALGRTLAEPVVADRNMPEAANSAMDGFAVRHADIATATPAHPVILPVAGTSVAGAPLVRLEPGQACVITTGGVVPDGADTVVKVEDTEQPDPQQVIIKNAPACGTFIRRPAQDFTAGTRLLEPGTVLTPYALSVAAAVGRPTLAVRRRPCVAVVSSGDEVVPVWSRPRPDQVRDANGPMLQAAIVEAGGDPLPLGILSDDADAAAAMLTDALARADIVITSGGISMGCRDPFVAALPRLGMTTHVHGASVRPGKPVYFGTTTSGRPLFCLPGNQASAAVTFQIFVRPFIDAWLGRITPSRRWVSLPLGHEMVNKWHRDHFARAHLDWSPAGLRVLPLPHQDSHLLTSLLAPALVRHPAERQTIAAGEMIACLLPYDV